MNMGFGAFDTLFPVMFLLITGIILATFVVVGVKGISQWSKNNASPVLTVQAELVAKRQHVSGMEDSTHTSYYATFQVESGDRMELSIPRNEFGLLAEDDRGMLTFQGTRYMGFKRIRG